MTIIIEGREAVMKRGSSFEFIAENRFFTGADSYTLSITFPLRGCQQNIDIFGRINRKDCDLERLLLDCEIHHKGFHRFGSIAVVDISETEVKTQFLEGKSARNFHSRLDELYINELDLMNLHIPVGDYYRNFFDSYDEQKRTTYLGFVRFPWVNNSAGKSHSAFSWVMPPPDEEEFEIEYHLADTIGDDGCVGQPFLMEVIREVLEASGYRFDISELEASDYRNLVVCNSLPPSWKKLKMEDALPHWTITEFLEELEKFLQGEFVFDEHAETITFRFHAMLTDTIIELDDVLDQHSVELSKPEEVENTYIHQKNYKYAEGGHTMDKYYSCNWIKEYLETICFASMDELYATLNEKMSSPPFLIWEGPFGSEPLFKSVLYVEDVDLYFILKCYSAYDSADGTKRLHKMRLIPVNQFGPRVTDDKEDGEAEELNIVPVCLENKSQYDGEVIFMECGELNEEPLAEDVDDEDAPDQAIIVKMIEAGEQEKQAFFDKIFVGYWDGNYKKYYPYFPHPDVDKIAIQINNDIVRSDFSLRISGREAESTRYATMRVDQSQKFSFSFLADNIPDVMAVFLIHGKKYLAEKITATVSEEGLSQQMKMVAYRVISS